VPLDKRAKQICDEIQALHDADKYISIVEDFVLIVKQTIVSRTQLPKALFEYFSKQTVASKAVADAKKRAVRSASDYLSKWLVVV